MTLPYTSLYGVGGDAAVEAKTGEGYFVMPRLSGIRWRSRGGGRWPGLTRRTAWASALALTASTLVAVGVGPAATAQAATSKVSTSCSASSAGDATTAAMLAKKCRESVAVDSEQTAYTRSVVNADGTITYSSSA